jgi:hypothetical protein
MAPVKHAAPALPRTLFNALWFPAFFVIGFMVFYLIPFHSPTPHHVNVVVVGQQPASALSVALGQHAPGAFDITSVPDQQAARDAVLHRDAIGAYDPGAGHPRLFVAKAAGAPLETVLQQAFSPVAAQSSAQLTIVDLAPIAQGDATGTGLFYLVMVCDVVGYVLVMMLLQAVALQGVRKLLTITGFGAVASTVVFVFGATLNVIPVNLAILPVLFLLSQAVAFTTFGLAPLVKQYIPGVAMGLFVLLSIPSSGGAIPWQMVPGFIRVLHPVMPLGQAIDAVRGILYFHGHGVAGPVLCLVGWLAVGVALLVLASKQATKTVHVAAAGIEEPGPAALGQPRVLVGEVLESDGSPVQRATVTITDHTGQQIGHIALDENGLYSYLLDHVPSQYLTVVVVSPDHRAAADRIAIGHHATTRLDFVLTPAEGSWPHQPPVDVTANSAAASAVTPG